MNYVSPKIACKIYGVTDQTLRRWAKEGTIEYINTFGGHHRYKIQVDDVNKRKIIYARVSSSKQKDNLLNQVNYLKNKKAVILLCKKMLEMLDFLVPVCF